ncbi:MAG: T9SS type A sorting domain-containing protein [Flavobacteriales bacterium]
MRNLIIISLLLCIVGSANAQRISGPTPAAVNKLVNRTLAELPDNLIFYEGFDNVSPPTLPSGWFTYSLSPSGFIVGTAGDESGQANENGFWPVPKHGLFAMTNDDVCNCDKSNDLLTSRSFDFTGYELLVIGFSAFQNGSNEQTGELQVKSKSNIWQTIFSIPTSGAWERYEMIVPASYLESSFQFRFKYNDHSKYGSGLAIDDVYITNKISDPIKMIEFFTINGNLSGTASLPALIPQTQAKYADLRFGADILNQEASDSKSRLAVDIQGPLAFNETTLKWRIPSGGQENTRMSVSQLFSPYLLGDYALNYRIETGPADSASNFGELSFSVVDSIYSNTDFKTNGSGIWVANELDRLGLVYPIFVEEPVVAVKIGIHSLSKENARFRLKFYKFPNITANVFFSDPIIITEDDIGKTIRIPVNHAFEPGKYLVAIEKETGQLVLSSNTTYSTPNGVAYYRVGSGPWRYLAYYPMIDLVFDAVDPNCPGNIQATITQETCAGDSNAQIQTTLLDDTPSTYFWSTGETTANISNLTSGTFTVTIGGTNDCTYDRKFVLDRKDSLKVSPIILASLCNDNSGSIDLNVSGGTPPWTISMNNSETGIAQTGLDSGDYAFHISDAVGCSADTNVFIAATPPVLLGLEIIEPNCGTTDGQVIALPSGGIGPYSFLWSNDSTTVSLNSISSGFYQLNISDSVGCVKDTFFIIGDSGAPTINLLELKDNSCSKVPNGKIKVQAIGDNNPITYTWSNFESTNEITSLHSGQYTLTVTDTAGCRNFQIYHVKDENLPFQLDIHDIGINCYGQNTASILALPSGGLSPYTFAWSDGSFAPQIEALGQGTYTLTVSDAANCLITKTTTITSQSEFFFVVDSLFGDTNGSGHLDAAIYLSVYGGTPPYTYNWSNGYQYQDLIDVDTGLYSVTITDQFGCELTYSKFLSDDPASANQLSFRETIAEVFPNPCPQSDQLTITTNVESGTIELYSLSGVKISQQYMIGPTATLSTPATSGTYVLVFRVDEHVAIFHKIIVL